MKKALGLALALSLLSLPGGLGVARADSMEETGEKLVAAMEDMATIVDKDKANCDGMADDLNTFADKNAALFAKGKEIEKTATPEQKKAWKEKYQKRVEGVMAKMKDGMTACFKNPKVKASLEKMKMK